MKGYVHIYTGPGKGKTTAAFGLALRAAGAGLRVFIAQFLKKRKSSEIVALERFSDLITIKQYGRGRFIRNEPGEKDRIKAREGLEDVRRALDSGTYDVVILDEANIATHFRLFPVEAILELIEAKGDTVELVITGRHADPSLIERADVVTEMTEIKHYSSRGVKARKGIEF